MAVDQIEQMTDYELPKRVDRRRPMTPSETAKRGLSEMLHARQERQRKLDGIAAALTTLSDEQLDQIAHIAYDDPEDWE